MNDKTILRYTLKDSTYSPNYEKALRYLNRTRDKGFVPVKAKVRIILLFTIIIISILMAALSS